MVSSGYLEQNHNQWSVGLSNFEKNQIQRPGHFNLELNEITMYNKQKYINFLELLALWDS